MTAANRTEREWQQFYDERAKRGGSLAITFGFVTPKTYEYRRAAIVDALRSLPIQLTGRRIADIGCGSGLISLPFRDGNTLVGIDISLEMLRLARSNDVQGAAASALAIPLRNSHFDVTIAAGIIQHFPRADEPLRECARITKPGGHVAIETINSESLLRRAYRFFVRVDNLKTIPFRIRRLANTDLLARGCL